jgi:divalent metal cation (Fe/Co/Zn/Cd) transporter
MDGAYFMYEGAKTVRLKTGRGLSMAVIQTERVQRSDLIRTAFILEWITLAWVTLEATVGIWAAINANSTSLMAFGIDSVIEAASACVLIWRLNVELRHGQNFSEDAERKASRMSGALLFALAAYVVLSAAWSLWTRQGEQFTLLGLAIPAATIPVMYVLARRKISIAEQIGSRALRADAMETITCGWLSFVVVAGLLAQLAIDAWWIDSVTSLAIVYVLVKEGREAWAVEDCSCSACH